MNISDLINLKTAGYLFRLMLCLVSFLSIQCSLNAFRTSNLPNKTPSHLYIDYNGNYGSISIKDNELKCEGGYEFRSWSAQLTDDDKDAIYQLFVYYKFDLMKGKTVEPIEGSDFRHREIRLVADDQPSYSFIYGPTQSMPIDSSQYFLNIEQSLLEMTSKYGGNKCDDYRVGKYLDVWKQIPGGKRTDYVGQLFQYKEDLYKSIFKSAKPNAPLYHSDWKIALDLLRQAIDDDNAKNEDSRKIELANYKLQILPVITETGEKEFWINSLCNAPNNWKEKITLVESNNTDKCYFNLKINISTQKYYDFTLNNFWIITGKK